MYIVSQMYFKGEELWETWQDITFKSDSSMEAFMRCIEQSWVTELYSHCQSEMCIGKGLWQQSFVMVVCAMGWNLTCPVIPLPTYMIIVCFRLFTPYCSSHCSLAQAVVLPGLWMGIGNSHSQCACSPCMHVNLVCRDYMYLMYAQNNQVAVQSSSRNTVHLQSNEDIPCMWKSFYSIVTQLVNLLLNFCHYD